MKVLSKLANPGEPVDAAAVPEMRGEQGMDQDHHRSKARECVVLAGQARQPGDQLELLAIAQAFLRLATFTAQQRPRDAAASLPQAVVEAAGRSL